MSDSTSARPQLSMGRTEFIAFCGVMFATIAFSIDAMLPALPEIGRELSPENLNSAQLILTSFVMGMGLGTFFTGPLSDSFGRKPVILWGSALYIAMALMAWWAQSLELVLVARFVQGIGAAGPRVVTMAIIRDLFKGREMAQLMSYAMLVFTLVPAIAPSIGATIIAWSGWRGVFIAFVVFSLASTLWMSLRLTEPLPKEHRRPFRLSLLISATRDMWAIPSVRIAILVLSLCFAMLFSMLSTVQQVYDVVYDKADTFHLWFGVVAIASGSASLLNAWLVIRFGMRFLVTASLAAQVICSIAMLVLGQMLSVGPLLFACFVAWQISVFFQAGMTLGNLNALAMEPLGHIAGFAASVLGAISTVLGALMAIPIGLAFNGTTTPLAMGIGVEALLACLLMLWMRRIEQHS